MSEGQIFLIHGLEHYLVDKEIKHIWKTMCDNSGTEADLVYIDADESSPAQLMEQLDFSPLFALERVAVIRRPQWLVKGSRKAGKMKQLYDALADLLSGPMPGQIVIFSSDENVSAHPLMKKLAPKLQIIACVRPHVSGLEAWLKEQAAQMQQPMTLQAVRLLARSGQDMYYLQQLLQKLSLQSGGKKISEQDIMGEFEQQTEINIFRLTDALLNRQVKAALQAYYQLLQQGGQPIFFLYMMVRQFALLGKVKDYCAQGISRQEMAKRTGAKDFAVRKMAGYANKFSWEELEYYFNEFLKTDISLKTSSRDAGILMEALIISICNRY